MRRFIKSYPLLRKEDRSSCFDSMELTFGSNIFTINGQTKVMDTIPNVQDQWTMLPIWPTAGVGLHMLTPQGS